MTADESFTIAEAVNQRRDAPLAIMRVRTKSISIGATMAAHEKGILEPQPRAYGSARMRMGGAIILLCVLPPTVLAVPPQGETQASMELGSDIVPPGGSASIAVGLRAASGSGIARLVIDVSFPHERAGFEQVRIGLMAEMAGAMVTSRVKPQAEDVKMTTVTIEVAHEKELPNGVLAMLGLKIPDGLEEGTEIPLQSKVVALTRTGDAIEGIKSSDGKVLVSSAPIPACFFYMH